MIAITAAEEGWKNHERARQLTSRDSRDASLAFPKLVDRGFIVSSGQERDKSCCLPGMDLSYPQEVFANALSSIPNLTLCVRDLTHSEPDSLVTHPERDEYGFFISRLLDKPFIDDLDDLSDEFRSELFKLAAASDWAMKEMLVL